MDYYFPPIEDFVPRKKASSRKQQNLLDRLLQKRSLCHWCKKPVFRAESGITHLEHNTATVDHIVNRAEGGADSWSNVVLACYECNQTRSKTFGYAIKHIRQKAAAPNRLFGVMIKNGEAT